MGACLHACLPHHALNLTKSANSEGRGFKDKQVPKSPVKTGRVFGKLPNTAEGSINLCSNPHSADKHLNYLASLEYPHTPGVTTMWLNNPVHSICGILLSARGVTAEGEAAVLPNTFVILVTKLHPSNGNGANITVSTCRMGKLEMQTQEIRHMQNSHDACMQKIIKKRHHLMFIN